MGEGVDPARIGQRVWVYGAQSYRPFGTAAQLTGITAHRSVFADGPVTGRTVLVHGVLGSVGSLAAQLARRGGAEVIATVRRGSDADLDAAAVADHAILAAYGTREDRPALPFRPLLWANVTIRLLGSDDFPVAAKREAASALTAAARDGGLSMRIGKPLPLDRIAEAHDRVDAGARERVLISLP